MAEIGGFGAGRMVVDQFGIARDDEHRRQVRRHDKYPAHAKMAEVEFIEFAGLGQRRESNPERGLRCMVFGQDTLLLSISTAQITHVCA